MSSPVFGLITGAQKCCRSAWEWIYSVSLVRESYFSFMMGNILSIPTAANENTIKSSWLTTLGVRKDGIGVPFSTGSICNMGSSTMGTPFGVLSVVLPASIFSCNVFASSLFACLFLFLSLDEPHSPQVSQCAA